jgi:hypothetical protein
MSTSIIQAITLIIVIALSFLLNMSFASEYSLQIIAATFIIYFILRKVTKNLPLLSERLIDAIIFTFILVTIVNDTGGLASPLFFLNFFLIFALSLLLEPVISISTTLTLMMFYLMSIPPGQTLEKILPLFALPFLTPFALFLGEEQKKITHYKSQITQTEIDHQKTKEQNLLFLSLTLKEHIKTILEAVENFVGERELNRIKITSKRAEKLIEEYEKEN